MIICDRLTKFFDKIRAIQDQRLGNILKTDWNKIWNHKLAEKLRDNDFAPEECHDCEWWEACAGGCALECIEGQGAPCQELG